MTKTRDTIYIHLPLDYFPGYRQKIADHHINPEILLTPEHLDSQPQRALAEIGSFLEKHQLSCTIHGPFLDLNPGSFDRKIRRASQERFQQLLTLISPLVPRVVVLHAAFDPLFYGDRIESWLHESVETWLPVAKAAEEMKTRIAIENVQEKTPEIIQELILRVDTPSFGVCFDIGHVNIFSRVPLSDWINTLGYRILELHLHDNHGQWDEHLALGEGKIDVPAFLTMIREKGISPALTIEAHNEGHALLSFQRLSSYLSTI